MDFSRTLVCYSHSLILKVAPFLFFIRWSNSRDSTARDEPERLCPNRIPRTVQAGQRKERGNIYTEEVSNEKLEALKRWEEPGQYFISTGRKVKSGGALRRKKHLYWGSERVSGTRRQGFVRVKSFGSRTSPFHFPPGLHFQPQSLSLFQSYTKISPQF